MADPSPEIVRPLKILHIFRAPVGGLFRHVLDLAREQTRRGHEVGILADSITGGEAAQAVLAELAPSLKLGLLRFPMRRNPHPSDFAALMKAYRHGRFIAADVVHGHGSKGGLYARLSAVLPAPSRPVTAYTPHGGSLNHRPGTTQHRLYMAAEALMARRTDLLLFESAFIADRYVKLVGRPPHLYRVVRNGIAESEFARVHPRADAADFLYVGELRAAKGIDTLLDALAIASRQLPVLPRALLVGTGPDKEELQRRAERLGLGRQVEFAGSLPARAAFERGKILVVPSRAESLPYIALEAAGARIPMISTNVGGLPEIFGPFRHQLLPPDNPGLLARRMVHLASSSEAELSATAEELARFVHVGFSIETMVDAVLAAYREAIANPAAGRSAFPVRVATSSQG